MAECASARARNADLAYDPTFAKRFPAVAEALLSGASGQLRNAATVGGNLLQRTRCAYFYDPASVCNKRQPSAGCGARGGENRLHAVLGWSESCIATHPSDFCVPLAALDAVVEIEGQAGRREVALEEFHLLPGTHRSTRACWRRASSSWPSACRAQQRGSQRMPVT
jgi:xanthine dehydrogenase YagS FAD-binding subunit